MVFSFEMARGERPRRIVHSLLGLAAAAAVLIAPASASAMRGSLDPSFGDGGRAFSQLGDAFAASEFTSMARQPDGKLLLTGWIEAEGPFEGRRVGVVERRDAAGRLDPAFGDGGILTVRDVGVSGGITGLAVQGDGSILFGDWQDGGCGGSATVHRLQANGAPDPSFGSAGVSATVPLPVERIVLDSSGRILVAGSAYGSPCGKTSPPAELTVARLLPDGSLDTGFGNGGVVVVAKSTFGSGNADGLAVREDGTILVAGLDSLAALLPNGSLDPGFGNGGVVVAKGARALLAVPGDKAVVASSSSTACCPGPGDFVLSQYLSNGSLDGSFGDGGRVSLDVSAIDEASALALAPSGDIVLAGDATAKTSCGGGDCGFTPILARFTAAGVVDPSFGQSGWTAVETPKRPASGYGPRIAALAIATGGQVLGAGGAGPLSDAFAFARLADGSPDPSFGGSGAVSEVRTLPSSSQAAGIAIEPGGQILASVWSDVGSHGGQSGLLGFSPGGHPDLRVGAGSGFSPTGARGGMQVGGQRHWAYMLSPAFGGERAYVARFDPLGRQDRAYGSEGTAKLPKWFVVSSFLARPDGSVLVLGRAAHRSSMAAFALAPDGNIDLSFGRKGLALVRFGSKVKAKAEVAAIDSRGRIVLAGRAGPRAVVTRLLANGSLDRRFSGDGRFAIAPSFWVEKTALALDPRGGILVGISAEPARVGNVTLRRLRPDGALDRSFGQGGVLRVRRGGTSLLSVFAGPRQIVLVVGRGAWGESGVTLRAYRPDGDVDRRFGHGGVVMAATSKKRVFRPSAAARQADGRIVVAGTTGKIEAMGARVELLRFR